MKILCPTDFSEHSKIALEYAVDLTNKLNGELHIVSAYHVPRKTGSFVSMRDVVRQDAEDDMEKLIAGLGSLLKDNTPTVYIGEDNASHLIHKYAEKKDIDLIVMGTQGSGSISNVLFGSVTRKISANSEIPVLAIPNDISKEGMQNTFVLALDEREVKDSKGFELVSRMARTLDISVDMVHVVKPGLKDELPFDPFVSSYLKDIPGEVNIVEGEDAVDTLKQYVDSNHIGMLIMIRRKHTFLEKLLFKGHTGAELANTKVPLMIIPE